MRTSKFSTILCTLLCLAFILGVTTVSYARLPMNQFGTNWVKTHKFQIYSSSGLGPDSIEWYGTVPSMTDLHMSAFSSGGGGEMSHAPKYGLMGHSNFWMDPNNNDVDENGNVAGWIKDYVARTSPTSDQGWNIDDEPFSEEYSKNGALTSWMKTARENGLIYLNTCVGYGPDIENMLNTVQPDILHGDFYPCYTDAYGNPTEHPAYFEVIKMWRDKAVTWGVPYFGWVEAFSDTYNGGFREPSESEMRMNVWSHLTMGYKGIAWFLYDSMPNSLVDTDRTPRNSYYWARSINSEIEKQGRYLRFLNNTDVRFVPNAGHSTPSGLTNWSSGAGGDNYILAIYVQTPSVTNRDALIGFFTDSSGQRYFMVQNLYRGPYYSAADTYAAFSIYYGNGNNLPVPNTIYRLDRTTGQSVAVSLNQGTTLNFSMPGGTAELFSYQPFSLSGKDTTAPKGCVTVNGGESVGSTSVTLSLLGTMDDSLLSQMCFSNDGSSWSGWETYADSKSWTLTVGDGMKTVYAKFKDEVGNISAACSDTVWLSANPSVLINAGAVSTDAPIVNLTLKGTAGATYMRFSNDNVNWSGTEAYSTVKTGWALATGTGTNTVYVQYYNGSWSGSYSDTITRSQSPYTGTPISIPGRIQAENFDLGGEGVAFHDTEATNWGWEYRNDGVDIEVTTDTGGGYNVGWTTGSEWLEYTVNVATTGYYDVTFRVASASYNSAWHLQVDGVNVTGVRGAYASGGWQTWMNVVVPCVKLTAGLHVMKLVSHGDMNINYIDITSTTRTPYDPVAYRQSAAPYDAPCTIQAEYFCRGGEGVGYHDYDAENWGYLYRTDQGVDIETCSEGVRNVGWISNGEWLTFIVNIPAEANYRVRVRVASVGNGQYSLTIGEGGSGTRTFPATGGFQTWATHETVLYLMPGKQVLKFQALSGTPGVYSGNNTVWNLNYIQIAPY